MTEQDISRLRAGGLLAGDEIGFFMNEVPYAECVSTGIQRRLFVEGVMLESRRTLLCD